MARLAQILRGIKITQAARPGNVSNEHLPITPELLRKIRVKWQEEGITKDKIMLWAAFTTCFFGFLRSGEVCCRTPTGFDEATNLSVEDVAVDSLGNLQAVVIHLKTSKTDPFRTGVDIHLAWTDDLCPVAALLSWLVQRGTQQDPLFQFDGGSALGDMGTNPGNYSGHSFKTGAATTAARHGISDAHIKQLGRWKSAAYQRYIRPAGSELAASVATRLSASSTNK